MALKKCTECGKEISDKAVTCPNCGCPNNTEENNINEQDKINNQTQTNRYSKKTKKSPGCLAGCLAIIIIPLVIVGIALAVMDPSEYSANSLYTKNLSVSEEEAENIKQIFTDCGLEKVKQIEPDELLNNLDFEGEKGYRLEANGIDNIILYMDADGKVYSIKYADNILYSDGAVVSKLSDYTFSMNEQSDLQIKCQNAVKEILKSPSTAKFPNILEWKFGKQDGQIIIQSYVDAQNDFGAETRSEFQFTLNQEDNTVVSFIFDGEELMQ